MLIPGRKYSATNSYRYGFNGQEKESELNDAITTAQFWEYDSRIGRRWNIDQIEKVDESPYLCFSGNPIMYADPLGLDKEDPNGKTLQTVIIKSKLTKKQKNRYTAVRELMKQNRISWGEAYPDIDANGNRREFGPSAIIIDQTKVGNSMEKDIRRISTEMQIKILKGFGYVEGSAAIILTGAELWEPALELATEKSIELYVTTNMALNSVRRKALTILLDIAIVKYGKDALYKKELWALSSEIKNYKEIFTSKTIITIVKKLDKILKSHHYF